MGNKSNLTDLSGVLFDQIENLMNAKDGDAVRAEIDRSKALTALAAQVINNGRLALDAMRYTDESGRGGHAAVTAMLTGGTDEQEA